MLMKDSGRRSATSSSRMNVGFTGGLAFAWLVGAVLCALLVAPSVAAAQIIDPPCGTTIDTPGETVIYTADLNCAGIAQPLFVTASNVTINGGGFTLTANNGDAITISSTEVPVDNVIVSDVQLTGHSVGVFIVGNNDAPVTNVALQSVTSIGGQQGINYRNVQGSTIDTVTIRDTLNDAVAISDVNTSNATRDIIVAESLFENIGQSGIATGSNRFISGQWEFIESECRSCARGIFLVGDGNAGLSVQNSRFEVSSAPIVLNGFSGESIIDNNTFALGPNVGTQIALNNVSNMILDANLCAGNASQLGVTIQGESANNIILGNYSGFNTGVSIQEGVFLTEVNGSFGNNLTNVQDLGSESSVTIGDLPDSDNDNVNDACDRCQGNDASGDTDNDLVCDDIDNCPEVPNPNQEDANNDNIGDACPVQDRDDDGVNDDVDICPDDADPDQEDFDGDGQGDVCDDDDDNDGAPDNNDGGLDLLIKPTGVCYAGQRGFNCSNITNRQGEIAAGDFNEDGRLDAVVANDVLDVCLNNDGGDWSCTTLDPDPDNAAAFAQIAVGDLDLDQHLDLVLGAQQGGNNIVCYGAGDGTFACQSLPLIAIADAIDRPIIANFNNDNRPDIIVARADRLNRAADNMANQVCFNLGNRNYDCVPIPGPSHNSQAAAMVDTDGDNIEEVVFANTAVLGSTADVCFRAGEKTGILCDPLLEDAVPATDVDTLDFNGDGLTDLVFATQPEPTLCRNTLEFFECSPLGAPRGSRIAIADFDEDGDEDVMLGSDEAIQFCSNEGDFFACGALNILANDVIIAQFGGLTPADPDPFDPNVCGDSDSDLCDDCTVGTDGTGPEPDSNPADDGQDTDSDGLCDLGDPDDDNDTVPDEADNCPFDDNLDQLDNDNDDIGDVCDADDDNDTVPDEADNCPFDDNLDQLDNDGDDVGDVCDEDDDNDTVPDIDDNCPFDDNLDQLDTDDDNTGNACDEDDDNDTVPDLDDNCPLVDNADQLDTDSDNVGDACEDDADGDTVLDLEDNCPLVDNADQANLDDDELGDACDDDDDGDGVLDDCELDFGLDPTDPQDGDLDPDADNLTNRQECLDGTDPTSFDGPTAPTPEEDTLEERVDTLEPILSVRNAEDPNGDAITHSFEVYSDPELTTLVASIQGLEADLDDPDFTRWQVDVPLEDNATYFWRARAADSFVEGQYSEVVTLIVDLVNEPPSVPTPTIPVDSTDTLTPTLQTTTALDPEGDEVTYLFELYELTNLDQPLLQAESPTPEFTLEQDLIEGQDYQWRASARDALDAQSDFSDPVTFNVNTVNVLPSAPTITSPAQRGQQLTEAALITWEPAEDPDGDPLVYEVEVAADESFDPVLLTIETDPDQTEAALEGLEEDQTFSVRVRAVDGEGPGPYAVSSFLLNLENTPPSTPAAIAPEPGDQLIGPAIEFSFGHASDLDGDPLTYTLRVVSATSGEEVLTLEEIEPQDGDQTTVTLDLPTFDDYTWSVEAVDDEALAGDPSDAGDFRVIDPFAGNFSGGNTVLNCTSAPTHTPAHPGHLLWLTLGFFWLAARRRP